ncbi:hypothetical protein BKA62DRAFT_680603 [Auriculariales sp. MPI-PUGE-AT-0066]|nr:hypothetical protein BKA62DRAFT_680603 [Auriculariales sp. MPI-PUGE-AT-0066]
MANSMLSPLFATSLVSLPMPTPTLSAPPHILRLSSPSFLDGVLTNDHGSPVYAIDTTRDTTHISRCTSQSGQMQAVASIHWSRDSSRTTVELRGSQQPLRKFLRPSRSPLCAAGTRKFRHPADGTGLRWRHTSSRSGMLECMTSKDLTPVATYEPALLTSRPKLRLYEPFSNDVKLVDAVLLSAILMVEQSPAAAATPAPAPTRLRVMEPSIPGPLSRESVLSDAFDGPTDKSIPRDVKDRTLFIDVSCPNSPAPSRRSLLSVDTTTSTFTHTSFLSFSPIQTNSPLSGNTSCSASPVSSSDAWSACPWATPTGSWEDCSASQLLQADHLLPVIPITPHKGDLKPTPAPRIFGDEPDPDDRGPPPPYEEHEWTVRIPAYRSTKI